MPRSELYTMRKCHKKIWNIKEIWIKTSTKFKWTMSNLFYFTHSALYFRDWLVFLYKFCLIFKRWKFPGANGVNMTKRSVALLHVHTVISFRNLFAFRIQTVYLKKRADKLCFVKNYYLNTFTLEYLLLNKI